MMPDSPQSKIAHDSRRAESPFVAIFKAMRPLQAPKNGLVLVPLFFSVNIWFTAEDVSGMAGIVLRSLIATAAFTLLSGAIYLINDIADAERDRAHPTKRSRPIASGTLSIRIAFIAAVIAMGVSILFATAVSTMLGIVAATYLAVNIVYTLKVKHVAILDIMSVSAGFVLRALAGVVAIDGVTLIFDGEPIAIDLVISPYLYIVTALGASLLALAKRRAELQRAGENAANQRGILAEYSVQFLDVLIISTASLTVMAYTLYTFSFGDSGGNVPGDNTMMLTIPFVAYGIYRYLHLLYVRGEGEAPELILLKDRPTLINIVLWVAVASAILLMHTIDATNGA